MRAARTVGLASMARFLCCGRRRETERRRILSNAPDQNMSRSNKRSNTKYNIITFIPLNLWHQFGCAGPRAARPRPHR